MRNETKVGAFVLIALVVLMSGISLLGMFKLSEDTYKVYVRFERIGGLKPGHPVNYLGVVVGQVDKVTVEGITVKVTTTIKEDIKIPKNSSFWLGSGGLMGGMFIDILPPADPSEQYFENGDEAKGLEGVSLDGLMISATDVLGKLSTMADSVNAIFHDKEMQEAFATTVKNTEEITTNLNELTRVFADVAVQNQGELNNTIKQLGSMALHMNNVATRIDSMLLTIDNDGKTGTEILATLDNLRQASENIEKITRSIEDVTGDETTKDDIKETIKNAREASAKANKMLDGLGGMKIKTSFDAKYADKPNKYRFDANLKFNYTQRDFMVLGVSDIGEDNDLNLQLGKGNDVFSVRGGIILGDVGAGIDLYPIKWLRLSADAYDPNDFKLRLVSEIKLSDKFSLVGENLDVKNSSSKNTYVGVKGYF